jgi:L-ribulose-5-phosphate 3-epimerase
MWQKSITLRAFPPDQTLDCCLRVAREAGFDAVEVNLESGQPYTLQSSDEEIRSLARCVAQHDLLVSAVYSREQWSHPITSSDNETVECGKAIIRRLSECATLLGTDAVLVVPGAVDNSVFASSPEITRYDLAYERATQVLISVAQDLERAGHGASLCIENVWNKFLLSPIEMRHFIDGINHPLVGAYFDVGNVLQYGFPEQWIDILGHRIRRIHFKDFRSRVGTLEGFVGLMEGDVNWPEVVTALRRVGYTSYITSEVLPPFKHDPFHLVHSTSAAMDAILARGDGERT